jgi:rod shape-determining protein MreD
MANEVIAAPRLRTAPRSCKVGHPPFASWSDGARPVYLGTSSHPFPSARRSGRSPGTGRGLTTVTVIIAVAGAAVAALFEITLWPYVNVARGHPHLVFDVALILATVGSAEAALAWGFAGGLVLDVLAPRPLGATVLVLLLVVGGAVVASRAVAPLRLRLAVPVIAAIPLSILYSLGVAVVVAAVGGGAVPTDAISALAPGAVFDAVVVGAFVPFALLARAHQPDQERVGW